LTANASGNPTPICTEREGSDEKIKKKSESRDRKGNQSKAQQEERMKACVEVKEVPLIVQLLIPKGEEKKKRLDSFPST